MFMFILQCRTTTCKHTNARDTHANHLLLGSLQLYSPSSSTKNKDTLTHTHTPETHKHKLGQVINSL